MSCNRHDDDAYAGYPALSLPATTVGATPAGSPSQAIRLDEGCIMFGSMAQPATPMGVTMGRAEFFCAEAVPLLDLAAVDEKIEHWRRAFEAAPDKVCRARAAGNLNALQNVRLMHGLPMLELEEVE